MDFYSIIISILRRFLGISLSWYVAVETTDPPITPNKRLPSPNPPKKKCRTVGVHAPIEPPTHPKNMIIVSAEDDCNSSKESESTTFRPKMMVNMGWKEGGCLSNS